MKKNKAVFLDRDGVLNPDPGYINQPDQITPYPFTARAISIFNKLGFIVAVVTNQSGVARGYITTAKLDIIHNNLAEQIKESSDAIIDKFYYSPYHRDGSISPWNIDHEDRKPDIGMFKKAQKDFNIDADRSYMIGDRISDMIFAHKAGLAPIMVLTGDGREDFLKIMKNKEVYKPEYAAQDVLAAALLIEKLENED